MICFDLWSSEGINLIKGLLYIRDVKRCKSDALTKGKLMVSAYTWAEKNRILLSSSVFTTFWGRRVQASHIWACVQFTIHCRGVGRQKLSSNQAYMLFFLLFVWFVWCVFSEWRLNPAHLYSLRSDHTVTNYYGCKRLAAEEPGKLSD